MLYSYKKSISYFSLFFSLNLLLSCNGGGQLQSVGLRDTLEGSLGMAQTSSSQRMSSNHYSGYHSSGANLIPGILSSHHYQQIDPMIELEINRLDLVGIGIFNKNLPEPEE